MSKADLLNQLARRYGVATSYVSNSGQQVIVPEESVLFALRTLGVALAEDPSEANLSDALFYEYQHRMSRPLPPAVIAAAGTEKQFKVHVHDGQEANLEIRLEDGGTAEVYQDINDEPAADVRGQMWGEASFHIPGNLPLGYHTIVLKSEGISASCPLIVTPTHLESSQKLVQQPLRGVMAQIYSVRSKTSWGMGDFKDLGSLASTLAQTAHADFLLINPLHAAEPFPPVEDSPYLPTSRRFINPIYLHIEDIPELSQLPADIRQDVAELASEFQALNTSADHIDRNNIFAAKLQVLRELFSLPRTPEREEAFQSYRAKEGQSLHDFAAWCAEREVTANVGLRHGAAEEVDELISFYCWLQFLCDEQLAAAQEKALAAGMKIGIMTDLAVGIHPGGADAVSLADYLAPAASVGAPPDMYNEMGQDWSQPPWHPIRLAEAGYKPWRELLESVLRNAGGVRVDHILGLFRLFWIPRMQPASTGVYVSYNWEAMVGILALEAHRAGAVVVGEDLGTLEPWVAQALASRGIMGTSVVWFEHAPDGSPLPQQDYRALALGSVGTHDLPPTLAYLSGDHIKLRVELGLLSGTYEEEMASERVWMDQVLAMAAPNAQEPINQMLELHKFIEGTPCALTCTNLVDMVGDRRAQNVPGTTHDLYPNWCIPLCDLDGNSVLIENLPSHRLYQRFIANQ